MTIQNKLSPDTINFESMSVDISKKSFKKAITRKQIEDYVEARRLQENLYDVFTHLLEVDKEDLDSELAKWLDKQRENNL